MNIHPTQVTNAASLSLFMVNLSHYRGRKYVEEAITMLPETPAPSLLERIITRVGGRGRIHAVDVEPIPA